MVRMIDHSITASTIAAPIAATATMIEVSIR